MFCLVIDENPSCVGYFSNGKISFEIPKNITSSWIPTDSLHDPNIEYAQIYCNGAKFSKVCPAKYRQRWNILTLRMNAFRKSFATSKVSLQDCCLFDLVPEDFLIEYCAMKQKIAEYILETYPRPENHDFLVKTWGLFNKISKRNLNFDISAGLKLISDKRSERIYCKLRNRKNVHYNIFGTVTGRLTTNRNSFPILSFDKSYRSVLKPNNDFFCTLDYQGCELRAMLALQGKEQPDYDIHEFNSQNIFGGISREESKKRFFSWFYNPEAKDEQLERLYNRDLLIDKFFDGKNILTPFGRKIPSDTFHATNYLLQSTTSDIVLEQALNIDNMLSGTKTEVAFTVHDALTLDASFDDVGLIPDIRNCFENTRIGNMRSTVSVGSNYGSMKTKEIRR